MLSKYNTHTYFYSTTFLISASAVVVTRIQKITPRQRSSSGRECVCRSDWDGCQITHRRAFMHASARYAAMHYECMRTFEQTWTIFEWYIICGIATDLCPYRIEDCLKKLPTAVIISGIQRSYKLDKIIRHVFVQVSLHHNNNNKCCFNIFPSVWLFRDNIKIRRYTHPIYSGTTSISYSLALLRPCMCQKNKPITIEMQ